jgi:branched-chain amino acid transport system substrate-binding protein
VKLRNSFFLVAALLASAHAAAQTPVKIGFMANMSGAQGGPGIDQYDGFMLVVERNGGKLGGVPVQIIKEDTQLKPDVALQAARKLIDKDRVPIITGLSYSNEMMVVHKPITEKEVFLVGSNAGPSPIAGAQCSPYQFIASWQNDVQSEVMGKYATEKGYKRVVALAPNYQAGKDYIAGFKRYYKGTLADELYTPLALLDYSAELTQLAEAKPDAVFVFYPSGMGVNFIRQYQQAGLLKKIPLLSVATAEATTIPALKEAALGVIAGTVWSPDIDNPSNKRFVEEFEKKYNRIPSQYAAQSYDAALLIESALARTKGNVADKKAFMAAMKEANFQSVRGKFKFAHNNFPIQDLIAVEVAKDPKGRVNLKTIGTPLPEHQDAYHEACPMK